MNTKLGTESETGIAPKESGSEFRTLLRHDYLISSHSAHDVPILASGPVAKSALFFPK